MKAEQLGGWIKRGGQELSRLFPLYDLLILCPGSKEVTGNLEETSGLPVACQSRSYTGFLSLNPDRYGKGKTETALIQYAYLGRVEEFVYVWEANELPAVLYLAQQC